jgi:hypothetical protein
MKKLLFLIILFAVQGYSQKVLQIYNYTSYTVLIGDIVTSAPGSTTEFYPDFGPIGPISLAPGASYILENSGSLTRFPFQSLGSTPYIANWYRRTSPTNVLLMTSAAAWVLGNPQVFDRLSFRILNPSSSLGTVGIANPNISGPGWSATYTAIVNPSVPTDIRYRIVIM